MLENETFEFFFAKSAQKEAGGEGVQKLAEKIRYPRRNAFVDDPLVCYL